MTDTIGNAFYREAMAGFAGRHPKMAQALYEIWTPTPWMCSAFTGPCEGKRDRLIDAWCLDEFGPERHPINPAGAWQRGVRTVNGRTWFGFATEEMLDRFMDELSMEAWQKEP